jgi:hypothetical protein
LATEKLTIELESGLCEWIKQAAEQSQMTAAQFIADLVRDERARRALEAMAAWVREDEDGPSNEEIDHLRLQMLADVESKP